MQEKIVLNDNTLLETRRKLGEAKDTPAEVLEQLSKEVRSLLLTQASNKFS